MKRPRVFRCRRCGEPIRLEPRPGFIVKGQPKYFPVNDDDGQAHYRRCRIRQQLQAAKTGESPGAQPREKRRRRKPKCDQQGEMF